MFSRLAPLLLVFLLAPPVLAGEALWTHQFAAQSGFPISLSQGSKPGQNTLVLFWASWCLPCKGELSDLAKKEGEIPAGLRIVAINVDDPSGLPLALSFLASIKWPFPLFRDSSGQFFYEYNRSLQLPFSVLLDSKGQEIKTFAKLEETDIQEILKLSPGIPAEGGVEPGKVQDTVGFHGEAVDFNGNNGIHNQMATVTGFARRDTKSWSAQAQYDFLYQEELNPHRVIRGDEIGYSYLEYHSELGSGRGQIRAGDSRQAVVGGELLNLQSIPNQVDPASLRGLSGQWDQGDWSFTAFGGEIHPDLFASPINPTTNLALPVPGEKVEGASAFWHREDSEHKSQINLNVVNYHREVNLDLGYATPIDDFRTGAEIYHSSGKSGLQVKGARFSTTTGIAGVDAEKPYIFDPYFWWSPPGWDHQIYSFHYIEYQSLPVRTLTPVLVETPALPLQVSKVRSFRFSPKFFNSTETTWFEPIWIFEESFNLVPYERQNSFGFNLSFPREDRKLLMFYQKGNLSPVLNYEESSLLATTPLYDTYLTGQLLLRHHQAGVLNGDSDGLTLGLDLSKIWTLPFKGKLLFTNGWTRQSGYYFGFSGISRTDLVSSHLEWSEGVNTIRLGVGSEPGGIVCTNGVCVQKPPLNGADLEIAFSF